MITIEDIKTKRELISKLRPIFFMPSNSKDTLELAVKTIEVYDLGDNYKAHVVKLFKVLQHHCNNERYARRERIKVMKEIFHLLGEVTKDSKGSKFSKLSKVTSEEINHE